MDGKPKSEQWEICERSRWEPCDIDPRLQAEPVGIGKSINSAAMDVGIGKIGAVFGGFHLDSRCRG